MWANRPENPDIGDILGCDTEEPSSVNFSVRFDEILGRMSITVCGFIFVVRQDCPRE